MNSKTTNSLDKVGTIAEHKKLIENKRFLKKLYFDFYTIFKSIKVPKGKKIELGSGGGILKKVIPDIITTDVVRGRGIDKVLNAEKLPFKNKSISAFYMLNVFHHIKNPKKALTEMGRCLKNGGKIIMIEPYNSPWGQFIYKNFHHEIFDPKSNWKIQGKGRMSSANGAMPWIVFVRDAKRFRKEFPNLKIALLKPHTPFAYLVSGGLSKPQLLPTQAYNIVRSLEKFLSPLNNYLSMFVTIVVSKP